MSKILMIVGSTRMNGYNGQLANKIVEEIGNRARVSFLDYSDLPFFNQNEEFPPPESLVRIRKEIEEADGLWIVTPEYNHQIPAYLKNLLDWLSRSLEEGNPRGDCVLFGKKVTVSSAGAQGGGYATNHVEDILKYTNTDLLDEFECEVVITAEEWENGELDFTEEEEMAIDAQIAGFLNHIQN